MRFNYFPSPLKTADKFPYFITVKNTAYFYKAGIWQPCTVGRTQYPWDEMDAYPIAKDFRSEEEPMKRVEYEKEVLSPLELE